MLLLPVLLPMICASLNAGQADELEIHAASGGRYNFVTGLISYTNDVVVKNKSYGAVLTADSISYNRSTGEVLADGNVRIQQGDQVWVGDHIGYNLTNNLMVAEEFRTGKFPVFAGADGLRGDLTNRIYNVYTATNAFITTDDFSEPAFGIRACRIRIYPDQRIEATHATLYVYTVPVFYFPYYSRRLSDANNIEVNPGYRSAYGLFALSRYNWHWNDQFDGSLHLDYREKRGLGAGPDLNYDLNQWGRGSLRYYYAHDRDPETNDLFNPLYTPLRENRHRIYYSYLATPATNLEIRAVARYQNDIGVSHDFFPGEYRQNPQPDTYVEASKFWRNFSLEVFAQPRVNDFYETVERLPEVRLAGYRQQVGRLPVYYESDSSAGWYRRLYADTNSLVPPDNYWTERADTYHQITAPATFFGWLNLIPRAGGRFTYYGATSGLDGADTQVRTNADTSRGVFNTGAEINFKASRLWPGVQNRLLDLDGVRHIVQPSANYVYVPAPNYRPEALPQFDSEMPSLRLLPIEYPEYNAIDSVDSQNTVRFGLANKLQTKRNGQVENLLNWEVFTDWRLSRRLIQETNRQERFSDIYSDLTLKPRSWMTLQSQLRFDPNDSEMRMSLNTITFEPNNTWNWTIGHFYLRDDLSGLPTALGVGNNILTSSMYYRLNENWGFRAAHHYDTRDGRMQEQDYTVYRDLRSWTVALRGTLRENSDGETDWSVSFTFSLKAKPRYSLGSDTVRARSLLGE